MDQPALAERLGVNHRYVRRLVAERRVPFIKFGHLLRFDPAEIDVWARCGSGWSPTGRCLIRYHRRVTDKAVAVGDLLRRARSSAGMSQRELARAGETSQAAVARYETGRVLPDLRTLDRLLGVCGQRLTVGAVPARRTGRESAITRPLAIPDDIAESDEAKAVGVVVLPPHIRWSGPPRSYDLVGDATAPASTSRCCARVPRTMSGTS